MAVLDPDDPRAPYLQVAGGLRAAIQAGELGPGAQLPTYQELADSWGVAVNTAKSAVSLLRDEGWVVVRHGKGSFVRTHPPENSDESREDGANGQQSEEIWRAISEIRQRVTDLEKRLDQR